MHSITLPTAFIGRIVIVTFVLKVLFIINRLINHQNEFMFICSIIYTVRIAISKCTKYL